MEPSILRDIVIIFALSVFVNLIFTKIKIPTVVGYLLTGVIAGPHLFRLISTQHQIELMAEIGVVLLLFTIGMEFSLKHLLRIRRIVFLGGFLQVSLTAGAFFTISRFYKVSWEAGLFIGFLVALSSSAIVLKMLQERSELSSNYGRTVLGILIYQDLMLVPLILAANLMGIENSNIGHELILILIKVIAIIAFVYIGNKWLIPKLLHVIALTKNQELFMMSIFLICLAIALITSKMGMSLAFGAFLAGLMVSESEYSHNAFGNLITFKDTFSSFFFVSIGMLLNLNFITENYQLVVFTVLLVLSTKVFIAGGTSFLLGHTFKGTVMVGIALCQVGEFSFILAKIGVDNKLITGFYYQLFLAVAVITMTLTPLLIMVSPSFSRFLLKLPVPKLLVKGLFPLKEMEIPGMENHLIIIGKDSSAVELSDMAKEANIPHVSIIFDPVLAKERMLQGDMVIYGDAINEPILMKAQANTASIVAISVGDLVPCMAIADKIRKINKSVYLLARSKETEHMKDLYKVGIDQVIPEKLEMAIDIFTRVLDQMLVPQKEANRLISHLRNEFFGVFRAKDIKNQPTPLQDISHINISAIEVEEKSMADGKSVAEIDLRKNTGVTLLAIKRNDEIIEHPDANTVLINRDIAYLLGNPEQVNLAIEIFSFDAENSD
jgi:monovalent cation:H+ antiporter-2, CPA2 family